MNKKGRPIGKREVTLSYVEMVFSNGLKYRFLYDEQKVYEIEDAHGKVPVIRGPMSIEAFITDLDNYRRKKKGG